MSKVKRLFVVDAMAMAFRNFHAFGARPLSTSGGLPTSALFGSAMFLLKLIEDEKPDYLVIATDTKEPTFRHQLYSEYKANRTEMPADLSVQIPYLYQLFEAMGIKLLSKAGVEADDLIGSLVVQSRRPDLHCYIVSGDKDFMQLLDDKTFMYTPKKGGEVQIIDIHGVRERFDCRPEQVIDILALTGDSSDNVPGVRGIGEKGAAKLIHDFGSVEGVYANLDRITNKRQHEGLVTCKDMAMLSKELVTIKVDEPIQHQLDEYRFDPAKALGSVNLAKLFSQLEFRNLEKRVREYAERGSPSVASASATPSPSSSTTSSSSAGPSPVDTAPATPATAVATAPSNTPVHYQLIDNKELLDELLQELATCDHFAFDTETDGLNVIDSRPIGLSIATQPGQAYYIPLIPTHAPELPAAWTLEHLAKAFADPSKLKIGHNVKFDLQMLHNVGAELVGPFADSMLCSYLLESSSKSHGLDACAYRYLGHRMIPITDLIGEKKDGRMQDVPIVQLTTYACEDADFTLRLFESLLPQLQELGLEYVFRSVDMPLVPILAKMEQTGVYVDDHMLGEISDLLAKMAHGLEGEIFALAGETFNIQSTKQLAQILFEKLRIHEQVGQTRLKKTKSGFSTDSSVLEKLSEHRLAAAVLEYRTVTKLKNTYVDTLPQLINGHSHRIHTSFHQTGTATGRLSSSEPNLQNIPIRSALGKEIRRAFAAPDDQHVILSADYSQIELRLLAHMAQEEALAEAFRQGQDIHTTTAARIFAVPPQDVDGTLRSRAKAINFGIIYGMGPQRLARETGVSVAEAKSFIEAYFRSYPGIERYIRDSVQYARTHQETRTLTGRRRPLTEIASKNPALAASAENMAVNSPVQGSAADLIKLAMIRIDKRLQEMGLKGKMLLQVHDELVFESPVTEADALASLVKKEMEAAMDLDVPLVVEIGIGRNWLEAQ